MYVGIKSFEENMLMLFMFVLKVFVIIPDKHVHSSHFIVVAVIYVVLPKQAADAEY